MRLVTRAAPLDDRPLWEYVPASLVTGVPPSCLRSSFVGPTATKDQMALCLDDYRLTGTGELFTEDSDADGEPDILATPRFRVWPLSSGLAPLAPQDKGERIVGKRGAIALPL